ncbi:hypothetical protein WR25_06601 [Diploscapter pachys]|uniref:C-CAP/cofactor C-like domain-containing protein n=1 Tax=Diploscapter pachys TaxID=2018661 RepID=A0A2A2KSU2_9BILA|nr:hypothetical protein WR25_06601 [Diploscapter pachys]
MQGLESEPVDERIEAKRAKLLARLHGRHANNQTSSYAAPNRHKQLDALLAKAKEQIASGEVDDQTIKQLEEHLNLDATSRQAKWVQDALQQMRQIALGREIGATQANGVGVKSFSFKISQPTSIPSTSSIKSPEKKKPAEKPEEIHNVDELLDDGRTLVVKDLKNETLKFTGEDGRDVRVCNISGGRLSFAFRPATVYIKDVTNCVLLFFPVKTSVLLYDCSNLNLHAAAQQIRVHSSHHLSLHVNVQAPGAVIIEDCDNVSVAPFRMREVDVESKNEFWRKVNDFNWLAEAPSPNWKIADEKDWTEETVE